jgi:hypothetical protein
MTPRLTKDFKTQAADFILETSRQFILLNFDKNDKVNKTINSVTDEYIISIRRNCFNDSSKPYFEDYSVSFSTIIENQKIKSIFSLEWENNELFPAKIIGDRYSGKIKIEKCIK